MRVSLPLMASVALPLLMVLALSGGASAQGLSSPGGKTDSGTPPKSEGDTPPGSGNTPGNSGAPATDLACFPSSLGSGHLRVEWPDSKRWAIFAWPAGSTIQVYVGPERARWCWGKLVGDVQRCIIDQKYTRDVPRGGC